MTLHTFLIMNTCFAILALSACGEKTDNTKPIEQPYITNADYVLDEIVSNKNAAVVLHAGPALLGRCNLKMSVEISKIDAQTGELILTNVLYPGKDKREAYGELETKDQLVFARIDEPGNYTISTLGCQNYGKPMRGARGKLATFQVHASKLNYLGQVVMSTRTLVNGETFVFLEVEDRRDFVKQKIKSVQPALLPYFKASLAKIPERVLSDKQKEELRKREADQVSSERISKTLDLLKADAKKLDNARALSSNISIELYAQSKRMRDLLDWLKFNEEEDLAIVANRFETARKMMVKLKSLEDQQPKRAPTIPPGKPPTIGDIPDPEQERALKQFNDVSDAWFERHNQISDLRREFNRYLKYKNPLKK